MARITLWGLARRVVVTGSAIKMHDDAKILLYSLGAPSNQYVGRIEKYECTRHFCC